MKLWWSWCDTVGIPKSYEKERKTLEIKLQYEFRNCTDYAKFPWNLWHILRLVIEPGSGHFPFTLTSICAWFSSQKWVPLVIVCIHHHDAAIKICVIYSEMNDRHHVSWGPLYADVSLWLALPILGCRKMVRITKGNGCITHRLANISSSLAGWFMSAMSAYLFWHKKTIKNAC